MKESWPRLIALALLMACVSADADSLVERRGEAYAGLPEQLEFDCSADSDALYTIFNRNFRIPENFESSDSDGSRFEWTVASGGGSVSVWYARIELGISAPIANHSYSWPAVSDHHENPLGVRVVSMEPLSDRELDGFTVLMVLNEHYLTIGSVVPIVWESLFDCFE